MNKTRTKAILGVILALVIGKLLWVKIATGKGTKSGSLQFLSTGNQIYIPIF